MEKSLKKTNLQLKFYNKIDIVAILILIVYNKCKNFKAGKTDEN